MAIPPADIAKAAEALNRHPDLSHIARRVGLELLNCIDRKTGLAWPSEKRMAAALGLSDRTIRRGKAELQALGLITWRRRGTSRKGRTPIYALAWATLISLATTIKVKVATAAKAARSRISPPPASTAPPVSEARDGGSGRAVGRTLSSAYLTQCFKFSGTKGGWKAPGTPQGQHLTDQQLDGRAHTRFYEALKQLGADVMAQLIDHPDATELEAKAIKAERYNEGAGLCTLRDLLACEVRA